MNFEAISADGEKLKPGDTVFNIYWATESKVSQIVNKDYLWLNHPNGNYSHTGDSKIYAKDLRFALVSTASHALAKLQEAEQERAKAAAHWKNVVNRLAATNA